MPNAAAFEDNAIEYIVGRQPSWIVRSGIGLIFVIMMVLLAVSWFIQYPDRITSNITLTTQHPPIQLIAKTNGRIMQLFVNNGQTVKQGDKLALLESNVEYASVIELKKQLERVNGNQDQLPNLLINGLGELQGTVNQLNLSLKALHRFNTSPHLAIKIQDAKDLTKQYLLLKDKLLNKRSTMQAKLTLENELLAIKQELNKTGLVADTELMELKNRHLDKKLILDDIEMQRELFNVTLKEIDQLLIEFKLEHTEKHQQLLNSVNTNLAAVTSQIGQWEKTYLLITPEAGKVSLSSYWSVNQQVKTGETVASILKEEDRKIGKMLIQQQGAGKVKEGQRVNIELASFPAIEYGYIEGEVRSLSLIPGNEGYMVDIQIPNDLVTTAGHRLPFTPNTKGTAQIITNERRLIQRFFDKVIYMVNRAS